MIWKSIFDEWINRGWEVSRSMKIWVDPVSRRSKVRKAFDECALEKFYICLEIRSVTGRYLDLKRNASIHWLVYVLKRETNHSDFCDKVWQNMLIHVSLYIQNKTHKLFRISYDCTYDLRRIPIFVCAIIDAIYFFMKEIPFFLIFSLIALTLFTYFNEIFLFVSFSLSPTRIHKCVRTHMYTCTALHLRRNLITYILVDFFHEVTCTWEWWSHMRLNESNLWSSAKPVRNVFQSRIFFFSIHNALII